LSCGNTAFYNVSQTSMADHAHGPGTTALCCFIFNFDRN